MGKTKIEITGLRRRWLISSLGPILVVALLVAGTFCVVMEIGRASCRERV